MRNGKPYSKFSFGEALRPKHGRKIRFQARHACHGKLNFDRISDNIQPQINSFNTVIPEVFEMM